MRRSLVPVPESCTKAGNSYKWQPGLHSSEATILDVWSATLSATWKAAENDCLERRNSIRPCVPSHVAYKAERGGNELFWSPWKKPPVRQFVVSDMKRISLCLAQHFGYGMAGRYVKLRK